MSIKVGDKVKLKALDYGASLGIGEFRKNGGEAVVKCITEDAKGLLYWVELVDLARKSRKRLARRKDLVVHHKPGGKKKCRKKRRRKPSRSPRSPSSKS